MAALRLLAVCLVAAAIGAAAMPHDNEGQQLGKEVAQSMAAFDAALQSQMQTQAVPAQDAKLPQLSSVSAACSASVVNLGVTYQSTTCASARLAIGVDLFGTGATQETMASFCTSSCFANIQAGVDAITANCSANADDRVVFSLSTYSAFVLNFQRARFLAKGVCVQNAAKTTYCWPQVKALVALSANGFAMTTDATVSATCSDECTGVLVNTVNQYGTAAMVSTVRAANLYCLKVDNTYCAPLMANIGTAITPDASTGRPNFATLCVPCVSAWIKQFAVAVDALDITVDIGTIIAKQYSLVFNMYCQKAADGQYCYDKFVTLAQSGSLSVDASACVVLPLVNTNCTAKCKNAVVNLQSKLGSCATALYPVLGGLQLTARASFAMCGVVVQDAAAKLVKASVRISNFLYASYVANAAAIKAAIAADIALKFSVNKEQVSVTSVTDSSTGTSASTVGIVASFTITPATTSAATTLQASFAAAFTSDSSMPATNQASGESAKQDPSQPAAADASSTSTQSSVVTNPNGGGVSAAPATAAAAPALVLAAMVAAVVAII